MGIEYVKKGDYYYPDFEEQGYSLIEIGKYGKMRADYLKKHRRASYYSLLTTGKLDDNLSEINRLACHQLELITSQLMNVNGITEDLKEKDQMKWVRLMNAIHHQAEEIVLSEIVYD